MRRPRRRARAAGVRRLSFELDDALQPLDYTGTNHATPAYAWPAPSTTSCASGLTWRIFDVRRRP